MRGTGRTFRVLMGAIYLTSDLPDDKEGVVLYAHNLDDARELFKKTLAILDVSLKDSCAYDYQNMLIQFPNGKTIEFRSMLESKERSYGTDWTQYQELSDHHMPENDRDFMRYIEARDERARRRNR